MARRRRRGSALRVLGAAFAARAVAKGRGGRFIVRRHAIRAVRRLTR
jgi:hypothetical protein